MGIVADDVDEAVRLARPFLPPETRDSRPRTEVQSAEPAPDEFKGVAHVQARLHFASEDEDDDASS
jgi:hypothetical protein